MRAAFDHIAVLHHKDQVGIFNGGKAVRNHKAGAPGGEGIHGVLNEQLRAGIDRGGRFVQNQHRRILQHGARNGEQLLLPRGNGCALRKVGVKPPRQRMHKAVKAACGEHAPKHIIVNPFHVIA